MSINPVTYNNWERGQREPDIENLIKLADYYNVTLDYLVGREFSNDVGYLTAEQREFVLTFLKLDPNKQAKAVGYVLGLA